MKTRAPRAPGSFHVRERLPAWCAPACLRVRSVGNLSRDPRVYSSGGTPGAAARRGVPLQAMRCTCWDTAGWGWRWGWRASGTGWPGQRPPQSMPVVFCSNHESNVDPAVLFQALHPAAAHPLQGRTAQVSTDGHRARRRRIRAGGPAGPAPVVRVAGAGLGLAARGQFLPDLSGGHAEPDRASCCRSRRAASSWPSTRRCRSCRWAISGGRAAMRKGSAIVRPVRVSVRIGAAHSHRRADARRP